MIWLKLLLLVPFLSQCYGVAEEYFEDEYSFTETISLLNATIDARRTASKKENATVIRNTIEDDDDDELKINDDEFKIYVKTRTPIRKKLAYKLKSTALTKSSTATSTKSFRRLNGTRNKVESPIILFKDYEYMYHDDTTKIPLKQKTPKNNNSFQNTSNSLQDKNVSKLFIADFYNLEPAVQYPNVTKCEKPLSNSSFWYIPEKYPCWQLPLLYGELGKRTNVNDIFLIQRGSLKNVNILDVKGKEAPKILDTPIADTHNKWCVVEPCYGDHTLCLFPQNGYSKVCDHNYSVLIPTTLEEIAMVNTVNSMRNRIANGETEEYSQLPPAANMKQMVYDYDLQKMAEIWLHQCLPGPAPCSALDGQFVSQLECTKYAEPCCLNSYNTDAGSGCIPRDECFVPAITGCIYAWFLSAGDKLDKTDVECGHTDSYTYNTAQLLWANTNKIGCAYGVRANGDTRVVCNFAPGAPFFIDTKYYCGLIAHKDITHEVIDNNDIDFTHESFLELLGLNLHHVHHTYNYSANRVNKPSKTNKILDEKHYWGVQTINGMYNEIRLRKELQNYLNGTLGVVARLVTRYSFYEESESRCDIDTPIYVSGPTGSLCVERGRRFHGLCYDFRDPSPGYRLVAVVAPVALFSLILYDLFSGVMRQTNY